MKKQDNKTRVRVSRVEQDILDAIEEELSELDDKQIELSELRAGHKTDKWCGQWR